MSEITARRWDKTPSSPNAHRAIEALEVATHRIRSREWLATHVLVIVAHVDDDGGANTNFTQAGTLDAYGQVGLIRAAEKLLMNSYR